MIEPDIVLIIDETEINRINFGVVPVDSESIVTVDLFNRGGTKLIDIEVKPLHKDVEVKKYPKELDVGERKPIVLRYKPIVQTNKGINSELIIAGGYIV